MSRSLSVTDRAYVETRKRILDGQYAGNDVITEGQVATALGISRTPVREAFLRLQAEGMLELYPKRGAVVVPVSLDEALPVMEAREVVEAYAVTKILTENVEAPADLLSELWEIVGAMTRCVRVRDAEGYLEADTQFHRALVAASGNAFLEQFTLHLRERQRRLAITAPQAARDRMEQSFAEHVAMVERLEEGELDALLSQLRAHLRAAVPHCTGMELEPQSGNREQRGTSQGAAGWGRSRRWAVDSRWSPR